MTAFLNILKLVLLLFVKSGSLNNVLLKKMVKWVHFFHQFVPVTILNTKFCFLLCTIVKWELIDDYYTTI